MSRWMGPPPLSSLMTRPANGGGGLPAGGAGGAVSMGAGWAGLAGAGPSGAGPPPAPPPWSGGKASKGRGREGRDGAGSRLSSMTTGSRSSNLPPGMPSLLFPGEGGLPGLGPMGTRGMGGVTQTRLPSGLRTQWAGSPHCSSHRSWRELPGSQRSQSWSQSDVYLRCSGGCSCLCSCRASWGGRGSCDSVADGVGALALARRARVAGRCRRAAARGPVRAAGRWADGFVR